MQLPTEGEELRKLLDVSDAEFRRLFIKYAIGFNMCAFFACYYIGLIISSILTYYQFHYTGYLMLIVGQIGRYKIRQQLSQISSSALHDRISTIYVAFLAWGVILLGINLGIHALNKYYDSIYINLWLKWKQGWFF